MHLVWWWWWFHLWSVFGKAGVMMMIWDWLAFLWLICIWCDLHFWIIEKLAGAFGVIVMMNSFVISLHFRRVEKLKHWKVGGCIWCEMRGKGDGFCGRRWGGSSTTASGIQMYCIITLRWKLHHTIGCIEVGGAPLQLGIGVLHLNALHCVSLHCIA